MKPIIKYDTVWKRDLIDFEFEVNNRIMLGWETQGGIAIEHENGCAYAYVQAMVLRHDGEVT